MTIWVDAHLSPAIANTSNARLREILGETLLRALALLSAGETLVEISGD